MKSNYRAHVALAFAALAYYYALEVGVIADLYSRGEGHKFSVLFLLKPAVLGFVLFRASRQGQPWVGLFFACSAATLVRDLVARDSGDWTTHYLVAFALLSASSLWWLFQLRRASRTLAAEYGLQSIEMVPLGVPIARAFEAYGEALSEEADEDLPEATRYTLGAGQHHEAVVVEWHGKIHLAAYHSEECLPDEDLACVMKRYSDGQDWLTLTKGYLYQREDRERRLWCSAMPVIGVGTSEYLNAQGKVRGDVARQESGAPTTDSQDGPPEEGR